MGGACGAKTAPLAAGQGPLQSARGGREVASQGHRDGESDASVGSEIRKYTELGALVAILRTGAVRLVRAEFLVHQYRNTADPMPCCQELPEEAFLRVEDITDDEVDKLSVFVMSYCWITADHPDPDRYHLADVARVLEMYLRCPPEDGPWGHLTDKIKEYQDHGWDLGGQGRPVAVFWDWCALPQDKPKGRRTAEESALFEQGLKSVNTWYANALTTVLALTTLPAGAARPSYDASGWTTFERTVAGVLTPGPRLLVVDEKARAQLDGLKGADAYDFRTFVHHCKDNARKAPCEPRAFSALIRRKRVTNGADIDKVLIPKYQQTFREVIGEAGAISLCDCGLTKKSARETLRVAKVHCEHLRELSLAGNAGVDLSLAEVAASCPELLRLDLSSSYNVSGNLSTLGARLKQLEVLNLRNTKVKGRCADLANLERLRKLDIGHTQVVGNIAGLAGLTHLQALRLADTKCEGDVAGLAGLRRLMVLELSFTKVKGDVGGLASLEALERLVALQTEVSGDVTGLARLKHLRTLNLRETQVENNLAGPAGRMSLDRHFAYDSEDQGVRDFWRALRRAGMEEAAAAVEEAGAEAEVAL